MKICSKCRKEWSLDHYTKKSAKCRSCRLVEAKEYRSKNIKQYREKQKEWKRATAHIRTARRTALRKEVLAAYGNKCMCCEESTYEFLTFDHIGGGGNRHRKKVSASQFVKWLIANNYPKSIQVLCYNCNCAKGHHNKCPHQI